MVYWSFTPAHKSHLCISRLTRSHLYCRSPDRRFLRRLHILATALNVVSLLCFFEHLLGLPKLHLVGLAGNVGFWNVEKGFPNDRHVFVGMTCCQHVVRHVANMVSKKLKRVPTLTNKNVACQHVGTHVSRSLCSMGENPSLSNRLEGDTMQLRQISLQMMQPLVHYCCSPTAATTNAAAAAAAAASL